jgi:hypothetical protein
MLTEKYLDEEKFIKYIRSLRSRYLELMQLYPDIEEDEDSIGPNCDEPFEYKFTPRKNHSWGPIYAEYLEIETLIKESVDSILECNQLCLPKSILLFIHSYNNLKYLKSKENYYLDLSLQEISQKTDEKLGISSTYAAYNNMTIDAYQVYDLSLNSMISHYLV